MSGLNVSSRNGFGKKWTGERLIGACSVLICSSKFEVQISDKSKHMDVDASGLAKWKPLDDSRSIRCTWTAGIGCIRFSNLKKACRAFTQWTSLVEQQRAGGIHLLRLVTQLFQLSWASLRLLGKPLYEKLSTRDPLRDIEQHRVLNIQKQQTFVWQRSWETSQAAFHWPQTLVGRIGRNVENIFNQLSKRKMAERAETNPFD